MSETLAELHASPARRMMGVGMMFALGALLIWMGFSQSYDNLGWQIFVLFCGAVALYSGMRMQQATAMHLRLTDAGLFDSEGTRLAAMDEIENVERGMLAFKPSNGFMIRTRAPQVRRWRPGLYWVMGRRIGVGGVTPAGQAKAMADIIALKLREHRGEEP